MPDRTVNWSAVVVELAVAFMLGCVVGFLDKRLPANGGIWITVTIVTIIAVAIGLRAGSAAAWRAAVASFVFDASGGTIAMWTMINAPPSEQPAVGPPTVVFALAVIVLALGWALFAAGVSWSVNALAKRA